jgi:hypothetical protein
MASSLVHKHYTRMEVDKSYKHTSFQRLSINYSRRMSFVTGASTVRGFQRPGPNVIKLFTVVIYELS